MDNNTENVTELLIGIVSLFSLLRYWLAIAMGRFSKKSEFLETGILEFSPSL